MSLDHILLGLLKEPLSGYDLKAIFDRSLRYFWPAELSQIYRVLKRLEGRGLLKSKMRPSDKGPDRRVYALTRAGQRSLREWLAGDPQFGDERFTYLAQLYFMGERRDLAKTLRFVEQIRDSLRRRLDSFRKIEREWRTDAEAYPGLETDEGFHAHLTLRMGLHRTEAGLKWCDETIRRAKALMAKRSKSERQH